MNINKEFIEVNCTKECIHQNTCCKVSTEVIRHKELIYDDIDLFIFGMGAGKDEAKQGRCFIGRSGQYMRSIIKHIWDNEKLFNLAISNNVRCHPQDSNGKDRAPTDAEINTCIEHLNKDLRDLKPKVIIPVGKNAACTYFPSNIGKSMTSIRGIPVKALDYTFIPTWHPSFLTRSYGKFNPEANNKFDKEFIFDILKAVEIANASNS